MNPRAASFSRTCFLSVLPVLFPFFSNARLDPGVSFFNFGEFGKVTLYTPAQAPNGVVLFISGDGGWQNEVPGMAQSLCNMGAVVAGVNLPHYLKNVSQNKCFYPAGDFEELSKQVQQRVHLPDYRIPLLAGHSSGATMVYVMLAQAPAGTFAGGISLGFCPDLEGTKEPCKGNGLHSFAITKPAPGWMLEPDAGLSTPWYLLHGEIDKCCDFSTARKFAEKIPAAHLVALPATGHGFSIAKNWMPRFREAYLNILQTQLPARPGEGQMATAGNATWRGAPSPVATALSDLPLVISNATGSAVDNTMAVFISGDGGWKDFDQNICNGLASKGIPVAGLNALKYFWTARTPESASQDLDRILRDYESQWGRQNVVLIGYSFGAEVMPFLFNRLPDEQKKRVKAIALLSPGEKADFEFHISSWLNQSSDKAKPVAPELEKMYDYRLLFLFGSDENTAWLKPMIKGNFQIKTFEGGHHYGGNTAAISDAIAGFLKQGT